MKILDPHLDIADMYAYNGWGLKDFYSAREDVWVTLPKLKQAGIDVVGATLYFDQSLVTTNCYDGVWSFVDFYKDLLECGNDLFQINWAKDLKRKGETQIGFIYAIEGMECLRAPADFEAFYDAGVRIWGFTWDNENEYATGRKSGRDTGLSGKGRQVIERMRKAKKLIVDIAHLSKQSVKDLYRYWDGMIVTTHGNSRLIYPSTHNLSDDEIQMIVDRDGVVSVFPLAADVGVKGTFEELYRHVDHIAGRWGIEHVGFSTDIYPLPEYPFVEGLADVTIGKRFADYLSTRISEEEINKILYENWIRVIRSAL